MNDEWVQKAVREALESDPANNIEVTPEYWKSKEQELEVMIAERLNIGPEHRKWMDAQILEALESDPADGIPITPQFWEDWRKELEEKIASGKFEVREDD